MNPARQESKNLKKELMKVQDEVAEEKMELMGFLKAMTDTEVTKKDCKNALTELQKHKKEGKELLKQKVKLAKQQLKQKVKDAEEQLNKTSKELKAKEKEKKHSNVTNVSLVTSLCIILFSLDTFYSSFHPSFSGCRDRPQADSKRPQGADCRSTTTTESGNICREGQQHIRPWMMTHKKHPEREHPVKTVL